MRKLLCLGVMAGLGLVGFPSPATAATPPSTAPSGSPSPSATPDPLDVQLQQQLAQQAAITATKESLAASIQAAHDQQSALSSVITANQAAIQTTLTQLAAAEKTFKEASIRQVDEHAAGVLARQQERADKAVLSNYVRQQYVDQGQFVDYVLSSGTISEMFGRASDVSHVLDRGQLLTARVHQDMVDAEQAEAAAKKDADTAATAAAQLNAQQITLQQQTDKATALIDQLTAQARAASNEIALANSQSLEVAQEIAASRIAELDKTIAAAEAADWDSANYWIQAHLGSLPGGFSQPPVNPGTAHFIWPAPGTDFVQPFGPSPYPFEPAFGGYPHFHTGLDLSRGCGAPILSAADGVVVVAGPSDVGYGNHIIIAHSGGFLTLYGHLQAMMVKPGDTVTQGQLVGLMGTTGNSTGCHLHFELRFDKLPIDPLPFLPALPPGAPGPPALAVPKP